MSNPLVTLLLKSVVVLFEVINAGASEMSYEYASGGLVSMCRAALEGIGIFGKIGADVKGLGITKQKRFKDKQGQPGVWRETRRQSRVIL